MAPFDMRGYARRGAEARLAELKQEMEAIYRVFQDLRGTRKGRPAASAAAIAPSDKPPKASRKRRTMSAAQRKAVSERMRKYWAGRRKEKVAQSK